MTQPPDPNAPLPGATPKETAAAFAERMKIASYQDFGSSYRPAFAHALATGAATPDQISSITSFVRALDIAKQARANAVAGVGMEHSAEQQDLLNSVGEDPYIVKRANSTAQDTKVPSATEQWFNAVGQNIATYSANSGDLIFPQPASFAGKGKAPSGSAENPVTHFLKEGLNQFANFAGWLYRSAKEGAADNAVEATRLLADDKAAKHAADKLGLTQLRDAQKTLGYDPNNPLSDLAFQWNHGAANFNDLSSVVQTYGQEHVNDALNVFYKMKGYGSDFNTALGAYMQDLAGQVRSGKLTTDQYVAKQQFFDSKEFQDVYKAVDMQHSSFGRDMAHLILPRGAQTVQDSAMFNFVSGVGDAAFDIVSDPTIGAGKLLKSAQLAKYGVDAMNATKVSRLLGVTDKVTGEENGATRLGGRIQGFLDSADKVRTLTASGDHVGAAAEHARMSRTYNDLMPMLSEVNGDRLALTPEQRLAAKAAGTKATILGTEMPVVKSDPIKTLDDFRDMLTAQGGLNRYARGAGAGTLKMMPGKVGVISRTLSKAAGANAARRVGAHEGVVLDYLKDADKIIPSDWSELFQKIAQSRGTAQFDALQGQLGLARRMKAGAEQMNRRITSLLPFTKTVAFNSVDAGANIERLARLSLPKYEASILRYIWDTAPSEATRRAIGRGIVNAVHEAAGTTRSVIGRDMLDSWNNGMDQLANRRYGLGETDRLARADGSVGRAALHLSQIETHLTLPSFEELRRVASKAAIFGYDRRLADGTLGEGMAGWFTDAAGQKDVAGGLARIAIHPWRTAKYGLFFSKPVERTMAILKTGWLLTTSNMLRQMSEEYLGIGAAGNRYKLVNGKRYLRLDNDANRFLVMAHNHLPSFRRQFVVTEDDAARELADSKWRMAVGDGEISAAERTALDELAAIHEKPGVMEMYGARQAGMADGLDVAIAGHADGVQHAPLRWKVAESHPARFKGYNEEELNGDAGRSALSDMYGQRFHDEDEPARRALAYLLWNKAAEDPKFLAKLEERPDLMKLMEELHPPERAAGGMPLYRVQEDAGSLLPSKKPQGIYFSHEREGFHSPHAEAMDDELTQEFRKEAVYQPGDKEVLTTPPHVIDIQGLIGPDHMVLEVDGGNAALKELTSEAEYKTLIAQARKGKESFGKYLKKQYPDVDWQQYEHSYDQLMTLGAIRAREAGYKAIWHKDANPNYNEYVALTDDAIRDRQPGKLLGASTGPLKDYVANDPRMGVFRQRAERLNTDQYGKVIQPGDEATKAEAVEDYVHNLIGDTAAAVYRQDGKTMHVPLVSDLLRGKIPSPEELKKLSLTNLPAHVIKAEFEPAPIGKIGKFGQGFTQLLSSGYDKLVTNPMYRLIRKPLFTANYVQSRLALMPWEKQLVAEFGWDAAEAKRVVSGMAEGQAMQDTIKYIDNPAMRSQFSVIAQNVWLFYRAQEDWARRWMRIVKENPESIRMAHMAIMAGTQTGMIDKDSDGNLIFSYPGSGLAIEAMMHVGQALGMDGPKIPHVDDLTSKVTYLNPAFMNPLGFSASPALSVPFDLLAKFIPGGEMLKSQADMAMEGQLGNGRAWWEQFAPTAVRRLIQLTPIDGKADNTGSTVGSAAATAVQNAALLGQLPTDTSDAVQVQKFITDTQTQTLNALVARSVLSFFTPGAPSMPELYGQEKADFTWRAAGVRTLKDEYQAMVQSFGFEKALVVWQQLHPDKLIYTVGKTDAAAKGASIDPTYGSIQWIQEHKDLFDGPYKRVAAYFVPPAPGNFDQAGWNAMLAIGVRQNKDLAEYYTDLVSKSAVTEWFAAKDNYDAATAAARSGDLGQLEREWSKENLSDARKAELRQVFSNTQNAGLTTKAIDAAYQQKKNSLYAQYPILHPYFNQTGARKDDTRQMVNELTQMVKDPAVNLPDLPGVAQMLTVKDNYERRLATLNGQRSTLAATQRQDLRNAYDDDMAKVVAQYPNLQDMYNGVFRYLEFS